MELVKIENNKEYGLVVSSRIIAERLGKLHKDVLAGIDNLIKTNTAEVFALFINSKYKGKNGKMNKEYLLTKDGFTLYMFNIQGHNDFKIAYINKFNEMEKQVQLSISNGEIDNNLINILLENQRRLEEKLDSMLLNNKVTSEPKKSKVELLPNDVREMIDKMLRKKKVNYSGIMRECAKKGIDISSNTIARYHKIQKGVI